MGNDVVPKLLINCYPDGGNRRERPKKRWRNNLRERLERHGLREIEAEDREIWKRRKRLSVEENFSMENLKEKEA